MSDGFGAMGGAVAGFSRLAATGLLAGTAAAGAFGVKAVMAASDLNEQVSKAKVVFGDSAQSITDFTNQMAKSFGLPKAAMTEAASSIGLIGKASGLSQQDAAGLSTQFAKLAADASSFYNVPLDDALTAIRSGLVGEAEPMRRFGVLLDENSVKQEAYRLGIAKVGADLTQQQKVQARSSLIINGMKDATGDLERTQDSFANRLREVKGRAENFAASVGTKLMPAVLGAFDLFEKWGPVIGDVVGGALERLRTALTPVVEGISSFVATIRGAFGGGGETEQIDGMAAKVQGLGDVFTTVREVIGGVVDKVSDYLATLVEFFDERMGAIQEAIEHVLNVISGLWDAVGDDILNIVKTAFTTIQEVIRGVMEVIKGVIDVALGILTGDWSRAWDGVKSIFDGIWDAIVGLLRGASELLQSILGAALSLIQAVWTKVWGDIRDFFSGIWNVIREIPATIMSGISGTISSIGGTIIGIWSGIWEKVGGFLSDAWEGIKGAVSTGIGDVVETIKGLPDRIIRGLGNLSELLLNAGKDLIRGFINGIKSMFGAVKNTLGDLTGKALSWKGPESRDKVLLKPAGHWIIEGFVQGIRDMRSEVQTELNSLNQLVSATQFGALSIAGNVDWSSVAGTNSSSAGGQALQGGGVSVAYAPVINIPAGSDPAILTQVQEILAADKEELVRVLRTV